MISRNPKLLRVEMSNRTKTYLSSRIPQRRNPRYKQRIRSGICCKYCGKNNHGSPRRYYSLNSIWAHFSYDHPHEDFKDHLMNLADLVGDGTLF